MLDAYIIEDLKRQEEARHRADDEARRPRVQIEDREAPERPVDSDDDGSEPEAPASSDDAVIRL